MGTGNEPFSLKACSPAIDRGLNDDFQPIAPQDLFGSPRVFKLAIDPGQYYLDMGAYEYQGTASVPLQPGIITGPGGATSFNRGAAYDFVSSPNRTLYNPSTVYTWSYKNTNNPASPVNDPGVSIVPDGNKARVTFSNTAITGNGQLIATTVNSCSAVPSVARVLDITLTPSLPVTVHSFDARKIQHVVLLEWITESEINNDRFEIERSGDGVNFSKLLQTSSRGNSNVPVTYQLFDRSPAAGINYYRLVQYDKDGRVTYFGTRTVQLFESANTIHIITNPVSTEIKLQGKMNQTHCDFVIVDAVGRKVQKGILQLNTSGIWVIRLSKKLPAGKFYLNILAGSENHNLPFIVL